MRFIENGPSIPDKLLLARDQGRVVFFCGAGVSLAQAGLPNFIGLAKKVIEALGVTTDSPVRKVLEEAREVDGRTGVAGLISADRLFGLLEQEFYSSDIENAVAQALNPGDSPNLSAHKIMLDLATSPEGIVRVVTTNFDRMFNDCNPDLDTWQPPRLPDPTRAKELDGVVYLHGRAAEDYSSAEGDGFVLSSAEFGRAYLAEAWATSFFKEILNRYVVVFVGYTADDPPVHYLLEALNKTNGNLDGVYAFQAGTPEQARVKWQHKGVEAIAYDEADCHKALWDTLKAWATRAQDIDGWYDDVIAKAMADPRSILPHERGQVAHVVSSVEGVKRFTASNKVPPAEWLCVFDKLRRYAKPATTDFMLERGSEVDPFDLYCIDSDPAPEKLSSDDYSATRELPHGVWDAFELSHLDKVELKDEQHSHLRGYCSSKVPNLSPRLHNLSQWLGKVAGEPAALWWAVRQVELHPNVINVIKWHIDRNDLDASPVIRKYWGYLFEYMGQEKDEHYGNWYRLNARIKSDGWSYQVARKLAACLRPQLKVEKGFGLDPVPPTITDKFDAFGMIRLDVEYPTPPEHINVPDDWLPVVAEELRKNLEIALHLENEIGSYGVHDLSTLTPEEDEDKFYRHYGVSGPVIRFSSVFESLLNTDLSAARREFKAWRTDDNSIFSLLRVWAARNGKLINTDELTSLLLYELSDEAFWAGSLSRDLSLTLKARWVELGNNRRRAIEDRIISGPPKRENESDNEFKERRAWRILNKVHWLNDNNCSLQINVKQLTDELMIFVPKWSGKAAANETRGSTARGGVVKTEKNCSSLMNLPLSEILPKAEELNGRHEDFLVEYNPFSGYSSERPLRAFACLKLAASQNEFPEWAWRTFLNSDARNNDKPQFVVVIAERLSRLKEQELVNIIRPASHWLKSVSKVLIENRISSFDAIVAKIVSTAKTHPGDFGSSLMRSNKDINWVMEAINSPIGQFVETLFDDPRTKNLEQGDGLPDFWLKNLKELQDIGNEIQQYTLIICNHNLRWFYYHSPEWTKENLLCGLVSEDAHIKSAFWAGFFWGAKIPNPELFAILKNDLLQLAVEVNFTRKGYGKVLSWIILAGWGNVDENTSESFISNNELRDILVRGDDDFRTNVLWQAGNWASTKEDEDNDENVWADNLVKLLRDVWPRQISAKSPMTTLRLCDLAFSNEELFPTVADLVIPLLVKVNSEHLSLPGLHSRKNAIVAQHPEQVLTILYSVLPGDTQSWPYGIDDTLSRIEQADDSLRFDERLLELKRKWNAR